MVLSLLPPVRVCCRAGEVPPRGPTPVVDVRDVSLAHMLAATTSATLRTSPRHNTHMCVPRKAEAPEVLSDLRQLLFKALGMDKLDCTMHSCTPCTAFGRDLGEKSPRPQWALLPS